MMLENTEVPLAHLTVTTADGDTVAVGALVDRPTVLVIPRYYGCLPCRGYLREVSEHLSDLDALGAGALAISSGTDDQAKWLMEDQGVAFPLLIDTERTVHEALELPRKWWVAVHPKGWWNYARALLRGNRQGAIVEPLQLPGLAILDATATVRRVHRGHALGDYPPIRVVLDELRAVEPAT